MVVTPDRKQRPVLIGPEFRNPSLCAVMVAPSGERATSGAAQSGRQGKAVFPVLGFGGESSPGGGHCHVGLRPPAPGVTPHTRSPGCAQPPGLPRSSEPQPGQVPVPMATAVESNIIVLDDEEEGLPPSMSRESPEPTPASPQPSRASDKKLEPVAQDGGSFKAENERLFEEFLECCGRLTEEHPEVMPFLASRHQKASAEFLASAEFRNVLGRCLTRVQSKRSKVYVYINELCTVLKAHTQRRKLLLGPAPTPPSQPELAVAPEQAEGEGSPVPRGTGSKRQIRYLENLLRVYMGEIRRLQERELDLAELDDEDSTYLQESRLKRKMMHIFERLCQLKQCSSLTGRVIEQRIPYRGTRYPEVNRRIERFINRPDAFPDYTDILKVIQKASTRHSLGLAKRQMQSMALDAFREVGNRLQERRHLDLVYNFGSHLTDQYRADLDPARRDTALARRLRENREMALTRLDSVISRYAQLQDESEEEERVRKRAARGSATPRQQEGLLPPPCPMASDPGEGQPHMQGSTPSQKAPEDDDSDSEEEEPSSDTDIEEELQQSQEGGEEEEEDAAVQDTEAADEDLAGDQDDQCMELGMEPLPCSSGGEDLEDEDDDDDEEEEEEEEEEESLPHAEGDGPLPHKQQEGERALPSPEQELFVLEIETLPLELSETPPPSPHIPGGSEATPKAAPLSPEPSEAIPLGPPSPETGSSRTEQVSQAEPVSLGVKQERGSTGDAGLWTQPSAKRRRPSAPASPLARPLENGGSVISSTSFNGSAGPPACKRGRRELPCSDSGCVEVHSVGSEEEDLELLLTGRPPGSSLPDSTRADSPFQSLVSSSQGSPQHCQRYLPKACKASVATQCDPEEIIVLSDSD